MQKDKAKSSAGRAASTPKSSTDEGALEALLHEPLTLKYPDTPEPDVTPVDHIEHHIHRYIHHATMLAGLTLVAVIGANLFAALHYTPKPLNERKSLNLAGVNIANKDKALAARQLTEAAKSQEVQIVINDTTYSYNAEELGIKRDFTALLDGGYASSEPLIDKVADSEQAAGLKTYVQKEKLISAIESKLGQYKTAVNASVSVSGGNLVVNPSKIGITLDFEAIARQLERTDLKATVALNAKLTTKDPEILTEAADKAKTQAEALIAPAYGASTGTASKLASPADKAGWLVFTSNSGNHTISASLNTSVAKSTMTKLAQSFTRSAKNRIILTIGGGEPTVIEDGQSGLAVDQNSLNDGLTQLEKALAANQAYTLPLSVVVQPQGVRNLGTANGGKFVLVDLAGFKAYAMDNTSVARTMLVSTGAYRTPTPKGHFTILRKVKLITMTGCNKLVGCWTVPNVPNAEFFTNEGHAFHGTYWHNQFGQVNRSHGCVNLSQTDAAWLYDWTNIGTDVIVV
jgi:hypothetical protein